MKKAVCKHCRQPIRKTNRGWVHDDPDEDPAKWDYGWHGCSGGGLTCAEPLRRKARRRSPTKQEDGLTELENVLLKNLIAVKAALERKRLRL